MVYVRSLLLISANNEDADMKALLFYKGNSPPLSQAKTSFSCIPFLANEETI